MQVIITIKKKSKGQCIRTSRWWFPFWWKEEVVMGDGPRHVFQVCYLSRVVGTERYSFYYPLNCTYNYIHPTLHFSNSAGMELQALQILGKCSTTCYTGSFMPSTKSYCIYHSKSRWFSKQCLGHGAGKFWLWRWARFHLVIAGLKGTL